MIRFLYVIAGTASLVLGILGIFLPLLPTTPFLLLTAFCYFRGSKRYYNWLMSHKQLGPYIKNFTENKVIPLRAKILSVSLMWTSMICCMIFFIPVWWGRVALMAVGIGVTFHILSFKSR